MTSKFRAAAFPAAVCALIAVLAGILQPAATGANFQDTVKGRITARIVVPESPASQPADEQVMPATPNKEGDTAQPEPTKSEDPHPEPKPQNTTPAEPQPYPHPEPEPQEEKAPEPEEPATGQTPESADSTPTTDATEGN